MNATPIANSQGSIVVQPPRSNGPIPNPSTSTFQHLYGPQVASTTAPLIYRVQDYSRSLAMMITPTPTELVDLNSLGNLENLKSLPWYLVFAVPDDDVLHGHLLFPYATITNAASTNPLYTRFEGPLRDESYLAFFALPNLRDNDRFNMGGTELVQRPPIQDQPARYDFRDLNSLQEAFTRRMVKLQETHCKYNSPQINQLLRVHRTHTMISPSLVTLVEPHIRQLQKLQYDMIIKYNPHKLRGGAVVTPFPILQVLTNVNNLNAMNPTVNNGPQQAKNGLPPYTDHIGPGSRAMPSSTQWQPPLYPVSNNYNQPNSSHQTTNTPFTQNASRLSVGRPTSQYQDGFTHVESNQQGAAAAYHWQMAYGNLGVGNSTGDAAAAASVTPSSFPQPRPRQVSQPTHVRNPENDYYRQSYSSLISPAPVLNSGSSEAPVGFGFVGNQGQALKNANAFTLNEASGSGRSVNRIERIGSFPSTLAEEHRKIELNPMTKERRANTNTHTQLKSQSQSRSKGEQKSASDNDNLARVNGIQKEQWKAAGNIQPIIAQQQQLRIDVASQHTQPLVSESTVKAEAQGYAIEVHKESNRLNPMFEEGQANPNPNPNPKTQHDSQSQTSRGKKRSAPDSDTPNTNDEEHGIRSKKQRTCIDPRQLLITPQQRPGLGVASQHMQPSSSTVSEEPESQEYAIQEQIPSTSYLLSLGNSQSSSAVVNQPGDSNSPTIRSGAVQEVNDGLHETQGGSFQSQDNGNFYHQDSQDIANNFLLNEVSQILGNRILPHEHSPQLQDFNELSEIRDQEPQISYPLQEIDYTLAGSQNDSVEPFLLQDFDHELVSRELHQQFEVHDQLLQNIRFFQDQLERHFNPDMLANDIQDTAGPHVA